MVNMLFIICLSCPTSTNVRIKRTGTLSILVTFYSQNPEYPVFDTYLVN